MAKPNAQWLGKWRDMILSTDGPKHPGAKLVALAVAKFLNIASMSTFVGAARLAGNTGLNEKTVRKHLTSLLRDGWLISQKKSRGRDWEIRMFTPGIPARAPEVFTGAQSESQAPEVFSRAPEVSSLSAGKNVPERRKFLPTNSGSLNTINNPVYRSRPFLLEKDVGKPAVPMPPELRKQLSTYGARAGQEDIQQRIEKAVRQSFAAHLKALEQLKAAARVTE